MTSDPNDSSPMSQPTAGSSEQTPNSEEAKSPGDGGASSGTGSSSEASPRRRILIGSQRDPAAYRPKPRRDWIPIVSKHARPDLSKRRAAPRPPVEERRGVEPKSASPEPAAPPEEAVPAPAMPPVAEQPQATAPLVAERSAVAAEPEPAPAIPVELPSTEPVVSAEPPVAEAAPAVEPVPSVQPEPEQPDAPLLAKVQEMLDSVTESVPMPAPAAAARTGRVPLPDLRADLPPDLQNEFQQALGDVAIDELITSGEALSQQTLLEPESRHSGRVVAVRRDDVFIELGGREQGVVPLRQFPKPPEPGATIEVRVTRFNPEEGIYELALPYSAAEIGDWSQLEEGMLVEARVTGHNTGGLECEVGHVRGFIPVSQIALYRVEDLAQFVGEKFNCVVTEANPERRNLVLSRRAVLEREQQEARQRLWESLEPGQIREGVVRKLMDFGAFVDIGGVDGLVHISQLGWGRVAHPREVLQEGQRIQVRIQKIDPETKRISLSYRELLRNPWDDVENKYPVNSTIHGKVTKLMEFGAFVELEPGVEGLVHISELSHKRVWRVSDVVKEGDEVDAVVLSVDRQAQRISLSMKNLLPAEPAQAEKPEDAEPPPAKKPPKKPSQPLRGGLGRSPGGASFGLKW